MPNKEDIASEQEWIKAAQKDQRAFGPLYEKYFPEIFRFIYKRLDSEQVCGDLCQQVFLKAMHHIGSYQDRGFPFSSWLYRIAINEVNSFYRKHKKAYRVVSLDRSHVEVIASESGGTNDIDELWNVVQRELKTIDEASLSLIELRFFDQKSFREMGEILGISEANAKIKTYRVLEKLKKRIAPKR